MATTPPPKVPSDENGDSDPPTISATMKMAATIHPSFLSCLCGSETGHFEGKSLASRLSTDKMRQSEGNMCKLLPEKQTDCGLAHTHLRVAVINEGLGREVALRRREEALLHHLKYPNRIRERERERERWINESTDGAGRCSS